MMKYDWENKIDMNGLYISMIGANTHFPKDVYIMGVVVAHTEDVEGAFVAMEWFPETIADADIAKDAIGDLNAFRKQALGEVFDLSRLGDDG